MSYLLAIFLGVIQGLTEFLPVSSSGHLVLLQEFLGFSEPPIFFDVMVHLGTLLAVVLFFGGDLERVLRVKRALRNIVVGTLPIVVVGLAIQPFVKIIFSSPPLVGASYLFTAVLLLWSKKFSGQKSFRELGNAQTLIVGLFQAVAILPGVSRSGATIVGGLSQNLSRDSAFKFSFYLSLPAILGAMVLQLKGLSAVNFLPQSFLGMMAATLVGYFALKILQKVLTSNKLYYFSFYCFLLGAVSLLIAS